MSRLSELQVVIDGLLADLAALRSENASLQQQVSDNGQDAGLEALAVKVAEARKLPAILKPPDPIPDPIPDEIPAAEPIIAP